MKIGFIGLGIMGSRMAQNLLEAGYDLTVWNRTEEKAMPLRAAGAAVASTPAALAREADVLFTMLAHPDAVKATASGDDGFLDSLHEGDLWVDCSTVNPAFSREMAESAGERGVRFIDAPVAGTKGPAAEGTLLFLVGGADDDVAQCQPLFDVMGRQTIHVGGAGMGTSLKMVVNALLAQAMLAFSEGMALGQALGLSRDKLFEVLLGGPVAAPFIKGKQDLIAGGTFDAAFPLKWMAKDLHLATLSAYEQGIAMPSTAVAEQVYKLAARHGWADRDFSAIYAFLNELDT